MKEGWVDVTLGAICESTSNIKWSEYDGDSLDYIDLTSVDRDSLTITETTKVTSDNAPSRARKIIHKDDVIFATTRPTLGRVTTIGQEYHNQICSTGYAVLRPMAGVVITRFIYYFILSESFMKLMETLQRGASYPAVSEKDVKQSSLKIPKSIEEQQQIVAILDDAFAAIEQAQANIEKNIDNAKELFQSKLNDIFSQKGEGWEEKAFKDVCVLQRGFDLPKRLRVQGDYPLVSSSGIIDSHVESKVLAPGVVTGRSGSIGNLFYIEEDFWPLNTTLYVKDFKGNLEEYVYYFIKQFDLKRFSSGAGVPTLNRNFVHDEIVFSTNSTKVQKKIVTQLNSLNSQAEQIQAIYKQKLTNLEDLKKSLLEQAFAGKLTCNEPNPTH